MRRNYINFRTGEILHTETVSEHLNEKPNRSLMEIIAITHNLYTSDISTEIVQVK